MPKAKMDAHTRHVAKEMLKNILEKHKQVKREGTAASRKMAALIAKLKKKDDGTAESRKNLKFLDAQKKKFDKALEKGLGNSVKAIAKYRAAIAA